MMDIGGGSMVKNLLRIAQILGKFFKTFSIWKQNGNIH